MVWEQREIKEDAQAVKFCFLLEFRDCIPNPWGSKSESLNPCAPPGKM